MTDRLLATINAIFLLVFLSGCAYKGALEPGFYNRNSISEKKIDATLVIDTTAQSIQPVRTTGGMGDTYEIHLSEAFYDGVAESLKGVFKEVKLTTTPSRDGYDYLVSPTVEVDRFSKDNWTGEQRFKLSVRYDFYRLNQSNPFNTFSDKQKVVVTPSSETQVLSFLTGASLFLLSPITIPAAVQAGGAHGEELLENGLKESLDEISAKVYRARKQFSLAESTQPARRTSESSSATKPKRHSKYDALMDPVVTIRSSTGSGSGFFVSENGLILTNNHVVGDDSRVSVSLRSGASLLAKVLSRDEKRDLALLKASDSPLGHLVLSPTNATGVGEDLIAVGAPHGLSWSVSKGILSSYREVNGVTVVQT